MSASRPTPRDGAPRAARSPASWVYAGVLCAGTALVLLPTVSAPALSLDDENLLGDFSGVALGEVVAYDRFGHLRPLKNLFFWLIARDRDNIASYRSATLACCVLSAALTMCLSLRLVGARTRAGSAAAPVLAMLIGACFAWNPTTASTVAWLSTANYVFALFGLLGYLVLADRALDERRPAPAIAMSALASLALGAAALFQQLVVVGPVLLVAYRHSTHASSGARRAPVISLGIGAAAVVAGVVAVHAIASAPDVAYRFAGNPGWLLAVSAPRYLLANLRLWLWDRGAFGVLYWEDPAQQLGASALAWFVVALLGWLAWTSWRRGAAQATRFALLWVACLLLPVTNLLASGNTPVALHYLYLPGVGLAILLGQAAHAIEQALAARWPALKHAAVALLGVAIAAWQPSYQAALRSWRDEALLYSATIDNHPDNVEARVNLISTHIERRQYREAEQWLENSLVRAPDNRALLGNQFELLWQTHEDRRALSLLEARPELRRIPLYRVRHAVLLERAGRDAEALAGFEAALREIVAPTPERFDAGYRLATLLVKHGRVGEARERLVRMQDEFPGDERLRMTIELIDGKR